MNTVLKPLSRPSAAKKASLDQAIIVDGAIPSQSKLKRTAFKVTTVLASTLMAMTMVMGTELYLHHRYGINLWGYRGPMVGQKMPGEKRIIVVGGSTTWGYGFPYEQSFPAHLQRLITERLRADGVPSINVLNLGFNNDGAYSLKYTLKDYEYLDYDAVVLYSGYNDLSMRNLRVGRNRSPVFGWTGYLPLLPAFTVDKINAWKARLTNARESVVFEPPAAQGEGNSIDPGKTGKLQQPLAALIGSSQRQASALPPTCEREWGFYCRNVEEAINLALARGKQVMIVTEPYIGDRHVEQQQALENMLNTRFRENANLHYINLGRVVDLRDTSLCWDGMHLTDEGNRRIAEALSQRVLEMLQQ